MGYGLWDHKGQKRLKQLSTHTHTHTHSYNFRYNECFILTVDDSYKDLYKLNPQV